MRSLATAILARRWNSRVGAIKSSEFGGRWGLIVDSAMNAPLLMEIGNSIGGKAGEKLRARGQAWAIHGFSRAYALTPDQSLLAAATATADYRVRVIPSQCVAPWDFDATGRHVLFDSSASAIAALGLLNLSRQTPDATRSAAVPQRCAGHAA